MPTAPDVLSLLWTASGAVGDIVASHNQYGPYVRDRTTPTDPHTSYQSFMRTTWKAVSQQWDTAVSATAKLQWERYASHVPLTDRLGNELWLTGRQHYFRTNVARLSARVLRYLAGPQIFNLGSESPPTVLRTGLQTFSLLFDDTRPWVSIRGSALAFYFSDGTAGAVNFYKGPYRYVYSVKGNHTTPPTSPVNITVTGYTLGAGKLFWRSRMCQADGRVANSLRGFAAVA